MKHLFLPAVLATLALAATSCGGTPNTPATPATTAGLNPAFVPTQNDFSAIRGQLAFDGQRLLTLKPGSEHTLTPEQYVLAQHALEVSNYMVTKGGMRYTAQPDGTLVDAGMTDAQLQAQGVCDVKIQYVNWINRGGVWSASNQPTSCGYWVGNMFTSESGWNESYSKTPPSSHWDKVYNTNTYWSMYNQFQCHFLIARGAKAQWNLEPSRPNVGYASTVAAGCNPGGGAD